jgi:DNA-binding transcriptional MerR regulator
MPSETDALEWISVAAFAAARGVSIRTVKRYIENGEVESKKDGGRRLVRLSKEGHKRDTNDLERDTQKGHSKEDTGTKEALSRSERGTQEGHSDASKRDTKGTHDAAAVSLLPEPAPDFAGRYVAQLETENQFLRSTIEQLQRDGAETRAALREALKAMPKQLATGAASDNLEQVGTTPQTTPEVPTTPTNVRSEVSPIEASDNPQRATNGEKISESNLNEINDLIFQVFGR